MIETFYKTKFKDNGIKDIWITKEETIVIENSIDIEDIENAIQQISIKAVSWDRFPVTIFRLITVAAAEGKGLSAEELNLSPHEMK